MPSIRLAASLVAAAAISIPRSANAGGPIQDNSFLIEEAYNQEPGVIQHINTFARDRDGGWDYSFTEEWPVRGQTHQLSVTFIAAGPAGGSAGVGDLALNYRLQAIGNGETRVAFSPRLTALLPTGSSSRGLGAGGAGVQINLPLSVMLSERFVTHLNVGGTYVPSARDLVGERGSSLTFAAGPSLIWLLHSKLNVMLEALYTTTEVSFPAGDVREQTLTVNPGVRAAIDFSSGLQIVPGIAVPLGVGPSRGERSIFFYLSFEHPFRLAGPTG